MAGTTRTAGAVVDGPSSDGAVAPLTVRPRRGLPDPIGVADLRWPELFGEHGGQTRGTRVVAVEAFAADAGSRNGGAPT